VGKEDITERGSSSSIGASGTTPCTKNPLQQTESGNAEESSNVVEGQSTAGSVTPVPPTPATPSAVFGEKQLKGVLRTLLTLPEGEWLTITINRQEYQFCRDESGTNGVSAMSRTSHFIVRGRVSHKLYWYQQFAAILTPSQVYVEFCALSNGDVCVGVWETRCSRPFHALLMFRLDKDRCELITAQDYRKIFPGVVFDPARTFDMAKAEE
jgi:hypothetical protein